MAIYTKKGDFGETSLVNGERISKDAPRIAAIGAIDEANSCLGTIFPRSPKTKELLKGIQKELFSIGAALAGSTLPFSSAKTKKLEKLIDDLEGELPVLKNFILPGGESEAAKLFFARALVRRSERGVAALAKKAPIKPALLTYLNRLSDALFMLARKENFESGIKEEPWKKGSR